MTDDVGKSDSEGVSAGAAFAGNPGAALKAAREEMGVSAREIADALNLSLAVVEGIEANDPARLPPTAFARGYIRSYAKLFELDADALVGQFEALVGETPTAEVVAVVEPAEPALLRLVRAQPGLLLGAGLALLLVLILVGSLFVGGDDDGAARNTASEPGSSAAAEAELVVDPAPDEPAFEAAPPVVDVSEPVEVDQRAAVEQASTDADAGASASPTVAEVSERRLTPDGSDRLHFRFSEDSWLVVSDGSGKRLYSNLGKAGSELRFVGQAPFRLVVGYAPGVRLSFNGDDVRLAPHTRNNKATLFLRP